MRNRKPVIQIMVNRKLVKHQNEITKIYYDQMAERKQLKGKNVLRKLVKRKLVKRKLVKSQISQTPNWSNV